jgi:signal transduction histidine kinase
VVEDSGIGITKEDQSMLFTRFFRSGSATEDAVQGTGLGLTIVQAIVSLHGGTIDVFSDHGQGTTVTVTLPRVATAVSSGSISQPGSATG